MLAIVKRAFSKSAEEIGKELDGVRSEGLQALGEIEQLEREKPDATSWEDAKAIDEKIARLRWTVDRCGRRAEELEKQFSMARAEADAALLKSISARWPDLVKKYLSDADKALKSFQGLVGVKDELERLGFGAASRLLVLPGHVAGNPILSGEILQLAAAELERRTSPVSKATPPAPVARKPSPKPQRATDSQKPIFAGERPQPAPPRARQPDDLSDLGPGEVRVKVLRAGYSPSDDAPQCDRGQMIRMTLVAAERAVQSGAVEFVEQPANSTAGG